MARKAEFGLPAGGGDGMTAEEFSELVDRIGLKPGKLAELLGKTSQTIRLYRCGKRNIPKLVIEKVIELDRLING